MSIGLVLLVIWLIGFMPFGLYWLLEFQSPDNNDVYFAAVIGWLWPLLLIPCLLIHVRRAVTGDRDRSPL